MPSYVLGYDAKAYYHASTTIDASSNTVDVLIDTMTEATNIKDLTTNIGREEIDITVRGDAPWKTTVGGLKDVSIEFQMRWEPNDEFFVAIRDAFMNETELALVCLSEVKTSSTAQGFAANFNVFSFNIGQELSNAQMVDISLKPSSFPQWVESDDFPSGF